jgi:hypothetical protein
LVTQAESDAMAANAIPRVRMCFIVRLLVTGG